MGLAWAKRVDARRSGRLTLALLAVVALLHRPPAAGAEVKRCDVAVLVDGVLRCDGEVAGILTTVCGPRAPIPRAGDAVVTPAVCEGAVPGRMVPDDLEALGVPIHVNTASAEDLTSLPGIGPVLAGRLIDARPHHTVEGLMRVRGIGPVRLNRIRDRVRLDP